MANLLEKIQIKLKARRDAAISAATEEADAQYRRDLEAAEVTLSLLDAEDLRESLSQSTESGPASKRVMLETRGWKGETLVAAVKMMKVNFTVSDLLDHIEKSFSLPGEISHVMASGFLSAWADEEDSSLEIVERGAGRRATIYRNHG